MPSQPNSAPSRAPSPSAAYAENPSAAHADNAADVTASRTVLHADDLARVLDRIAHQILEKTRGGSNVVLLGIPTRGAFLAHRLAERIASFAGVQVGLGTIDVTMHRDDLRSRGFRPLGQTVEPEGGLDGRLVILVDDVLFSGRTVRAALDAITDLGRPRAVQLAVLIDRGHRELPIRADYVGKNLPTSAEEQVRVSMTECDGADSVSIIGVATSEGGIA
jgi:pyrimidine operon attenuation protein/uracil phosphoribosyltransferase